MRFAAFYAIVRHKYNCGSNQLTSLEGAPQKIGEGFYCYYNPDLSSLFGLPEMPENEKILCNNELNEKYDCPKSKNGGIYYKDLIKSTAYKSEICVNRILAKRNNQNKDEADKKRSENLKSGYAAFKKKFKPGEREG